MTETLALEEETAAGLAASKLRLRGDKVVLRLLERLKAALAGILPEDQTVIFTLTAPIRAPAKTAAAIKGLVRDGLPEGEVGVTINGNHARLRRIVGVGADRPRIVGFVHNQDADAALILAWAEARLLGERPRV